MGAAGLALGPQDGGADPDRPVVWRSAASARRIIPAGPASSHAPPGVPASRVIVAGRQVVPSCIAKPAAIASTASERRGTVPVSSLSTAGREPSLKPAAVSGYERQVSHSMPLHQVRPVLLSDVVVGTSQQVADATIRAQQHQPRRVTVEPSEKGESRVLL